MATLTFARRPLAISWRPDREAWRVAWQAWWSSRLVVLGAGVLGVLSVRRAPGTLGFDPRGLTSPFGYLGNLLVSPFARWDSVWYLTISHYGYGHDLGRAAFFPLYPLSMRVVGAVVGSDLVAGILISLASFAIALGLLYRLAALELGQHVARVTVLLLAFCPLAFVFSAVYSESLFLALSLGCLLRARSGGWASAGLLGGLAAAERATGIALLVPLFLMFLYGPRTDLPPAWPAGTGWRRTLPRYRPTAQLGWLLLVPAGLGAFLAGLALWSGEGLAPLHAGSLWYRHFAGPFGGVWDGIIAAWDGVRQLVHGPPPPVYFPRAGGNALTAAEQNLVAFGFLVLGAAGLIGALRRLPLAYGAYALASLALPLSYPVGPEPLQSLSRYEAVLFPLFMWGGWWVSRRGLARVAVPALAVLLGLFTVQFATWRFVA